MGIGASRFVTNLMFDVRREVFMNTYIGLQWLKAVALTVSLTTLATVSVASSVEDLSLIHI